VIEPSAAIGKSPLNSLLRHTSIRITSPGAKTKPGVIPACVCAETEALAISTMTHPDRTRASRVQTIMVRSIEDTTSAA
jgi:hypothetical protein